MRPWKRSAGITSDQVRSPTFEVRGVGGVQVLCLLMDAKGNISDTRPFCSFGTEKVVWIFTATRKVMVATAGQNWIISDWDQPVDLLDGLTCNVAAYLKQEGVVF